MVTQKIPSRLQAVLWSSNIKKLDLQRDKSYIIHQTLSHGSIRDIQWLFTKYPRNIIIDTFRSSPYKGYRKARFNFIRSAILNDFTKTKESDYVINTPRNLR